MTRLHRRGFVRAEGTQLVDDSGTLLPRGVGLGNWLLAEGYMWLFGDELASPRQIEHRIETLVGADRASEFWHRFRDAFVGETDFALIAALGFDHVRLPINARGVMAADGTLVEAGFDLIERAVAWSEQYGLRILLDLHGAPGGQTGTNIDDSEHGRPELFMRPIHREHTIALWRELALRYRDREAVFGYDLLNEPLPNEWQYRYADHLVDLYRDLTTAVREIDDRHLIMYEGSHWATNWAPLRERFDDNQALQFHRYWCQPDDSSIAEYLAVRDRLETPIYMGEGGENTPAWIYAATRLYERHGIGWNLWPWKKLGTRTSPLSAGVPDGWEQIADMSARPDADVVWRVLEDFLSAVEVSRCETRTPVLDAVFARPTLVLPAWAGRTEEGTTIAAMTSAPIPDGLWHHTSGTPYSHEEYVPVSVSEGSRLMFDLAAAPSGWKVEADDPDAVAVVWDGQSLVLEARSSTVVRWIELTS
ncbi:cellulase (glycosyl hydrolase family 5) [Kribbella sp. VKM Ac-2527]|uniref:Cellulase (Glycosyl hydrolase family 5) n=1 Tax=Kribbella caucasensis TaxID=2512215 RepID=A0A4R6KQ20_9ACTN|nr:cellulase family glycosylhydrolase [Kribbella sp. VKM Ac-2527]TDO51709.1 cellulase (glycosyl hydrolase family 5) [Kribbella sp. VKM Ac-2527]